MTAKRGVTIRPKPVVAEAHALQPEVLLWYSFAPEWFHDALQEAQTGHDHGSRRREILFAVCFAESYLFEWVRDKVLNRDRKRLNKYFPPKPKRWRGVDEKWKAIPKELHEDGLIERVPDLGGPHGENWNQLIKYRDGLVHARTSRPESASLPEEEMPVPSKTDLKALDAGWAVGIAIERVRLLHDAVRTRSPEWLVDP